MSELSFSSKENFEKWFSFMGPLVQIIKREERLVDNRKIIHICYQVGNNRDKETPTKSS